MKPDCYKCEYIGEVTGSAHACCNVLKNLELSPDIILLFEIALAAGKVELNHDDKPVIELDPIGVKNGWAAWPINFDPTWIRSCKFYTNKTDESNS